MPRWRAAILSMVILAQLAAPAAVAQTHTRHHAKAGSTLTAKINDASNWSRRQWQAAKAKWSHETARWSDCRKQANRKSLSGRKSWTFLYNCMTK